MKEKSLLEIIWSRFFWLNWFNSWEIDEMIWLLALWFAVESKWMRSSNVVISDRTSIDDRFRCVWALNRSRIRMIRWRYPDGNRTSKSDTNEKAIIVSFVRSLRQSNIQRNHVIERKTLFCKHTIERIIFERMFIRPVWTWNVEESIGCSKWRRDLTRTIGRWWIDQTIEWTCTCLLFKWIHNVKSPIVDCMMCSEEVVGYC